VSAELAVLQRLVFGRSSERVSSGESAGEGAGGGQPANGGPAGGRRRGRAGNRRRDYSHLPRVEVLWDFEDGGYCCPGCGLAFAVLGEHVVEQIDWRVVVRVLVHRRRRYERACACEGPKTVTAPGPPKAIGKGLFGNGFIALLLTERYVAGRSLNSLVAGLGRQGAALSAATLTGTCAAAGALLAPLEEAITARSRDSWHLHADETSWRVFAPREQDGPARWWLWVFRAPRGAVSYRLRSRWRWEELSLDLMADLEPKGEEGTAACQETGGRAQAYGAARREIRVILAKAGLPES
jgi:transposase